MRYAEHYSRLISRARGRDPTGLGYFEKHHIVPRCCGGGNARENIAKLTAREHFVAHQLLAKINPEHAGLQMAAAAMTWHRGRRYTNRKYSWIRERCSVVCAARARAVFTGVPKSEAQKKKVSKALKGRPISLETRARQSAARKALPVKQSVKNIESRMKRLAEISLARPDFSTGEKPIIGISEPIKGRFRWTLGARYTGRALTKTGFLTAAEAAEARDFKLAQLEHLA